MTEAYVSDRLTAPTINIIGYHVEKAAEDYLKEMTRGMPGRFKAFKN